MTIAMAAMVATVWKGHQNTETETTAHICPYQIIYQTEQAIPCPVLLLSASSSLIILLSRIRSAIFWSAQVLFIDIYIYILYILYKCLCCHTGHPAMTWMKKAHLATKAIVSVPNLTQSTVTQPQLHTHIYCCPEPKQLNVPSYSLLLIPSNHFLGVLDLKVLHGYFH